jgi:hypothetical protein
MRDGQERHVPGRPGDIGQVDGQPVKIIVGPGVGDLCQSQLELGTWEATRLVVGNQALGDQRAIGCADPHRTYLQGICHADIVADRATEGQRLTLGPDLSKSGRCDIPTVVVRVLAEVRRTRRVSVR